MRGVEERAKEAEEEKAVLGPDSDLSAYTRDGGQGPPG